MLTVVAAVAVAVVADEYVVHTKLGALQGGPSSVSPDIAFFGSIPYATPPVGPLRWQSPQAFGSWPNVRDATKFGNRCMQSDIIPVVHKTNMSEDCLFLNIATATSNLNTKTKLPVMVWIHGGAYVSGQSNDYPLDHLVHTSEHPVIVVTLNYRLNVFGFLGSQEIASHNAAGGGSYGNFGIEDQRLAMQWVTDNIEAFGGDSTAVTIFGESAGGNSVFNHLAQKKSFPLYKRAIIESGAYDTGAKTSQQAQQHYSNVVKRLKCTSLQCLLGLESSQLSAVFNDPFGPCVDGVNMAATPAALVAAGDFNTDASVIIGSNRDEMAYFLVPMQKAVPYQLTEAGFDALATIQGFGPELKTIKELYSSANYSYPAHLGNYSLWWFEYMRVATDQVPGLGPCGARNLARNLVKHSKADVFVYFFTHPTQTADPEGRIPGIGPGSNLVPHASEIGYVFGDASALTPGEEGALADAVCNCWSTFAATGNPNSRRSRGEKTAWQSSLPVWPAYSVAADTVMRFDVQSAGGPQLQAHTRAPQCDFWDTYSKTWSEIN